MENFKIGQEVYVVRTWEEQVFKNVITHIGEDSCYLNNRECCLKKHLFRNLKEAKQYIENIPSTRLKGYDYYWEVNGYGILKTWDFKRKINKNGLIESTKVRITELQRHLKTLQKELKDLERE